MSYRPSYSNQRNSPSFYGNRIEISLRDEIISTLEGSVSEISKKRPGLLRVMNRDQNGQLLPCACVTPPTGEPDKTTPCPLCLGDGYYWTEIEVFFYAWEPKSDAALILKADLALPGEADVSFQIFYLDYTNNLHFEDKMVELVLDNEGVPVQPLQRQAVYRIGHVYPYRLDNGRLEYWKVAAFEERLMRHALNVRY